MASWLAWMSSLKRKAKSCCHMLCSWFWGASQITGSEVIATHCTNDWLRAVKWLSVEYWVIIKDSVFATESYDTFERKKLNEKFFYEQQCSLFNVLWTGQFLKTIAMIIVDCAIKTLPAHNCGNQSPANHLLLSQTKHFAEAWESHWILIWEKPPFVESFKCISRIKSREK